MVHVDARQLWTYRADADGNLTTGGYSRGFTVRVTLRPHPVRTGFAACAPLLCAGITTLTAAEALSGGSGFARGRPRHGGWARRRSPRLRAEVSVISHGRSKEADVRRWCRDPLLR